MNNRNFFQGKTVWITGGSSGIGKALSMQLSEYGAKLIISSNVKDELEQVKADALKINPDVASLIFDLSVPEDVEAAVEKAMSIYGKVDILINAGGISQRSLTGETSLTIDRRIMEINFFSGVILTKKLLPSMIANGYGHFVAISSITGKFGWPYRSAYAASKHAVKGFYESLWTEYSKNGIRVTVVYPGRVKTNISLGAIGPDGKPYGKMDEGQAGGITPEKCALDILKAVRKNKIEILSGGKELLMVHIRRFLPSLFYKMALRMKPN
jgi:dehydrogenase/reductase SDR family member 7B